jgi:hypothetical protein
MLECLTETLDLAGIDDVGRELGERREDSGAPVVSGGGLEELAELGAGPSDDRPVSFQLGGGHHAAA